MDSQLLKIMLVASPMPRRGTKWLMVTFGLALLGAAGCSGDRPVAPSASVADDPGVVHVHGLGINPADGVLYAATHTGLFTVRNGGAKRVAEIGRAHV